MAYSVRTRKTEDKTTHVAHVPPVKRDPIHNSVSYVLHQKHFILDWGKGSRSWSISLCHTYVSLLL